MSDKELQDAARKCEKALLADLPEPEDCPDTFSRGFERRMKRLIFRVDRPVRFWLLRLLPVLLAAGITAAALLLPKEAEPVPSHEPPVPAEQERIPPAEKPVPSPDPAEQEPAPLPAPESPAEEAETVVYRPTWLPEGCAWDRETLYDGEGMIVYRTPGGAEAVFFYRLGGETEEHEGEDIPVGEGAGTLLLGQSKEELNELFWSEEGVSFWLTAPFTREDLVRVAESVEKDTAP